MAILLLGIMALNIARYQLPHIGYGLFRDYIAQNLCVQRFDVDNECRGTCHLNRQIDLVNESDQNAGNSSEKEQTVLETDDCIPATADGQGLHPGRKISAAVFLPPFYLSIYPDIPMPPPKRLA
jgi:hypothetical protein